jgi:hypothetical protein
MEPTPEPMPPQTTKRNWPLLLALYGNAMLLLLVLAALLTRRSDAGAAYAAPAPGMPAIAGGEGIYLMPGQFSQNVWGCYVMDTQRKSLLAYEYVGGTRSLRLVAARGYEPDLDLHNYNTFPSPAEIKQLNDMEKAGLRGKGDPTAPNGEVLRPPGEKPN